MTRTHATEKLSASYSRWRSSRLGRITDALEQELLVEMLAPVAGKSLLDVGCGDGELASALVRRGAIVIGVDADVGMIAEARRRGPLASMPLKFIVGQAQKLPFEDATFDRVIAVTVLCFVDDAGKAIAEMARVLRPGGRLVIGELGYWSLWAAQRRIRGWLGDPIWQNASFRTALELHNLLRAPGLVVEATRGAVYYPPCAIVALGGAQY